MEPSLIEKIKSGDMNALGKIYVEYRSKFILHIRSKYSSVEFIDEIAKDIYQETIESVYNNIKSERLTTLTSLSAYIFSIGHNKISEVIRKKSNQERGVNMERLEGNISDDEQEKEIRLALITTALSTLSESSQKILQLFYYESKDIQEIALVLNMNYDTVKSIKSRALKVLLQSVKNLQVKNLN